MQPLHFPPVAFFTENKGPSSSPTAPAWKGPKGSKERALKGARLPVHFRCGRSPSLKKWPEKKSQSSDSVAPSSSRFFPCPPFSQGQLRVSFRLTRAVLRCYAQNSHVPGPLSAFFLGRKSVPRFAGRPRVMIFSDFPPTFPSFLDHFTYGWILCATRGMDFTLTCGETLLWILGNSGVDEIWVGIYGNLCVKCMKIFKDDDVNEKSIFHYISYRNISISFE